MIQQSNETIKFTEEELVLIAFDTLNALKFL